MAIRQVLSKQLLLHDVKILRKDCRKTMQALILWRGCDVSDKLCKVWKKICHLSFSVITGLSSLQPPSPDPPQLKCFTYSVTSCVTNSKFLQDTVVAFSLNNFGGQNHVEPSCIATVNTLLHINSSYIAKMIACNFSKYNSGNVLQLISKHNHTALGPSLHSSHETCFNLLKLVRFL